MTTLTITPNLAKKTAKFAGAVAAGEHVEVTLKFGASIADTSSLRMRVVSPCGTLAIFPQPESEDAWEVDGEDLKCVLNLNTIQMLKALAPAIEAELLVVLDDAENHVLYFKDTCAFKHWPMRRGDDAPYDLDGFPGLIEEWREEIDNLAASVEKVGNVATISITDKDGTTTTAEVRDGERGEQGEQGPAVEIDATLTSETKAAQAKAVGDALTAKQDALTFDNEPTSGSANPVKSGGVKTALDGKVDKSGYAGSLSVSGVSLMSEDSQIDIIRHGTHSLEFLKDGNEAAFLDLTGANGDVIAFDSKLPYAKSSTVGTRQVLTITATTAQSVTLPAIPNTDEVLNCDIVVNGTAATADFGLTLVGGTGVSVYYPNGEAITCKSGCVTMVSCVGINGLGWLVVGCNNLKTAS